MWYSGCSPLEGEKKVGGTLLTSANIKKAIHAVVCVVFLAGRQSRRGKWPGKRSSARPSAKLALEGMRAAGSGTPGGSGQQAKPCASRLWWLSPGWLYQESLESTSWVCSLLPGWRLRVWLWLHFSARHQLFTSLPGSCGSIQEGRVWGDLNIAWNVRKHSYLLSWPNLKPFLLTVVQAKPLYFSTWRYSWVFELNGMWRITQSCPLPLKIITL